MLTLATQFLLQDTVRARLGKEAFDFDEGRSAGSNAPYAMEAAQRLTADFGRLGNAPDGLPFLDHLRHLLTGAPTCRSKIHHTCGTYSAYCQLCMASVPYSARSSL